MKNTFIELILFQKRVTLTPPLLCQCSSPVRPLMLMRPSTSLTLQPSSPISDLKNDNSYLKDNKELLNSWRKLGLLWFCISSYDLPPQHTLNCKNADEIFDFSLAYWKISIFSLAYLQYANEIFATPLTELSQQLQICWWEILSSIDWTELNWATLSTSQAPHLPRTSSPSCCAFLGCPLTLSFHLVDENWDISVLRIWMVHSLC